MGSLDKYIPLVEFMGLVFGRNFEVILHDVSKPEASTIAIVNNHVSGRCIGAPMTDLALKILSQNDYMTKDYIANYEGKTKDGKILVSSTFFLKEEQKLVGMICVNHDVQDILDAERAIEKLKSAFCLLDSGDKNGAYSENLDDSIAGYSNNLIHATLANLQISPQRMSVKEKISVIGQLEQQGIFSTKGSVFQLAEYFGTSESTIYRYITRARKQQD